MRTKNEILKSSISRGAQVDGDGYLKDEPTQLSLLLEVLVDIRDLLANQEK